MDGLIGHYRLDQRRRFAAVLAQGGALVGLGALITGTGVVGRHHSWVEWVVPLGVAIVAAGPIVAAVRMHRLLFDETFVALRRDALVVQIGGQAATVLPWTELRAIRHDAARDLVVLEQRGGGESTIDLKLDGTTPEALARELEHTRKRAAMELL